MAGRPPHSSFGRERGTGFVYEPSSSSSSSSPSLACCKSLHLLHPSPSPHSYCTILRVVGIIGMVWMPLLPTIRVVGIIFVGLLPLFFASYLFTVFLVVFCRCSSSLE
ncbi:unnamed protein product [Victoria cruziana]